MTLVTEPRENGRDPYPARVHWCRAPNAQRTRLRRSCPLCSVLSHEPKKSPSKDTSLSPRDRVTACKTIASLGLLPSEPSLGGTQNQDLRLSKMQTGSGTNHTSSLHNPTVSNGIALPVFSSLENERIERQHH